ncbi:MAG: UDP-N-acetylmuramoyl-tripeptide--D-alanyl-D-alanine ligase [Patescibacteria group bacterium]
MKKFIVYILRILTKRTLTRYKPVVVGITGSVGKTSTKEAIFTLLNHTFFVAKSSENANNEIGVPCAVLGIEPSGTRDRKATWQSRRRFLIGLMRSIALAYGPRRRHYPKILILELGADKPGDMGYLSELLKPQVVVVTAIGEVPAHVEFYKNPEAVAREKAHILDYVGVNGFAALGADDPIVLAMSAKGGSASGGKFPFMTFGFSQGADLRASDLAYYMHDHHVAGLSFKIHKNESFVPIRVPGLVAPHQIQSILAAAAVGLHFGMNLVEIGSALESYRAPEHRVQLITGINGSTLLDDTYNASPLSARAALEALHELGTALHKRRVAVLGDMKELGEYAKQAHEEIAHLAPGKCDVLITVGELAKAMGGKEHFPDVAAAAKKIPELIQPNDVVLIKGSHAMHMLDLVSALGRSASGGDATNK